MNYPVRHDPHTKLIKRFTRFHQETGEAARKHALIISQSLNDYIDSVPPEFLESADSVVQQLFHIADQYESETYPYIDREEFCPHRPATRKNPMHARLNSPDDAQSAEEEIRGFLNKGIMIEQLDTLCDLRDACFLNGQKADTHDLIISTNFVMTKIKAAMNEVNLPARAHT